MLAIIQLLLLSTVSNELLCVQLRNLNYYNLIQLNSNYETNQKYACSFAYFYNICCF